MSYDILVYGPVFCDLIFTGLPGMPVLGQEIYADGLTVSAGGSAIVAAGLSRLGARTGLIADLGDDPHGRVVWDLLGELGLDRSLMEQRPGAQSRMTVALSFPQDRAFITRCQPTETPPDLEQILRKHSTRHIHLCSFHTAYDLPNAPKIAHAAGATISLDPGWDEQALVDPHLASVIYELDLFMPSRAELCQVAQTGDLDEAASRVLVKMRYGELVVKDGPNGAIAFWLTDRGDINRLQVPSLTVTPLETTGAGDAFDAGYLYAQLQGLDRKTCMQYGVVCGALATTAVGGPSALPTLEEVEKWRLKLPS